MSATERPIQSGAWWAYFVLMLGLTLLSLLFGPLSPLWLLSSIVGAFALVGLWGYIRQVAVGWRPFCVGYFFLSAALSLASLILSLSGSSLELGLTVFLSLGVALTLPLYLALWRYAFHSPAVWSQGNV